MARYEHLPIYKQAMDIVVYFEKTVAGFSRYHKYTLGTELRNQSKKIVVQIIKSNQTTNKQMLLLELRQMLEELLLLVRVAKFSYSQTCGNCIFTNLLKEINLKLIVRGCLNIT